MSGGRLLIPNLGAEEGPAWRRVASLPEVRATARLWRLLFAPGHEIVPDLPDSGDVPWPPDLPAADEAVFPWLEDPAPATAWLNDRAAADEAASAGRGLSGADPDVVRRVHDKAFAREVAARESLEPPALRGLSLCFEPEELVDCDTVLRRIEAQLAGWPGWLDGRFTLKPRFGTTGRGRFDGARDALDPQALAAALPRLASRGGAVLEPWLPRRCDLSALLWIAPGGELTLLGTLEQHVSETGVYRGHSGVLASRGRVGSGNDWEAALRDAAVTAGLAAAEHGYHGPCGVDAFVTCDEAGSEILRPLVELNARFSVGTVVLGLVRRALPAIRRALGTGPGDLTRFAFSLRGNTGEPARGTEKTFSLAAPGESDGPWLRVG